MNDLLSTRKRGLKKIVVIFGILVIVFIIFKVLTSTRSNVYPDVRGNIASAKAVKEINREFFFPLKDENGKEVSKIKFLVENAELRDEIVVKGQKATSIKGRTFFIINLKITNEHNSAIQINSRDYIRLSYDDATEWLAP